MNHIIGISTNLIGFILVLGVLIFAHEAGHFFMAKFFRVRVLVFSFGFGKRLFGIQTKDTDYRVSLIPLGGYVRMAGDEPQEGRTGDPGEFLSKPKWQRFLILLAGPAANVVIAIVFLAGLLIVGTPAVVEPPIIGRVVPGKPADVAGLKAGDRILSVDGDAIDEFEEFRLAIVLNAGRPLNIEYARGGQRHKTILTPAREETEMGPIGRAHLDPYLDPVIGNVRQDSLAWGVGIRPGDRIVEVDGKPLTNFVDFQRAVMAAQGKALKLGIQRAGKRFSTVLPGTTYDSRDPFRGFLPPTEIRKLGLGAALKESVEQNWKMLKYTFTALGRIFRAEASVKELSGPLSIARISGEMLRRGWMEVVALMAMISLQLGIMNLLPIPVLDGGHIMILGVEGVVRRELSLRVKERIQQAGLAMLAALMIVVLYNDVIMNVKRVTGAD